MAEAENKGKMQGHDTEELGRESVTRGRSDFVRR